MSQDKEFNQDHGLEGHWAAVPAAEASLLTACRQHTSKIGFFEADLVAHCGTSVAGTFIWTLVMTDVASGWTECFAMAQRSGSGVVFAIRQIQRVLPFPILGIDTDNGSEFINEDLMEFCRSEKITFTRGRVQGPPSQISTGLEAQKT